MATYRLRLSVRLRLRHPPLARVSLSVCVVKHGYDANSGKCLNPRTRYTSIALLTAPAYLSTTTAEAHKSLLKSKSSEKLLPSNRYVCQGEEIPKDDDAQCNHPLHRDVFRSVNNLSYRTMSSFSAAQCTHI